MIIVDLEEAENYLENDRAMLIDTSKHDSELLDKVAEKLKARYYYMETEWGWGGYTVTDKDIDEVLSEYKKGAENEI